MLTPEEINRIIPFAPMESCKNIATYIRSLFVRKYSNLYELDYELAVNGILERVRSNYNPKLGPLIRYTKNTLSLKMKDYIKRNHVNTVEITEDVLSLFAEPIESYDLSEYSDTVISAIYNVIIGKGTKKEKDIITNVFNIKE